MARNRLCKVLIVAGLFSAAPAYAAPNVFWIFGFTQEYGHGAGGRAAADVGTRQANLAPAPSAAAGLSAIAAAHPVTIPVAPVLEYAALDVFAAAPRPVGVPDL